MLFTNFLPLIYLLVNIHTSKIMKSTKHSHAPRKIEDLRRQHHGKTERQLGHTTKQHRGHATEQPKRGGGRFSPTHLLVMSLRPPCSFNHSNVVGFFVLCSSLDRLLDRFLMRMYCLLLNRLLNHLLMLIIVKILPLQNLCPIFLPLRCVLCHPIMMCTSLTAAMHVLNNAPKL